MFACYDIGSLYDIRDFNIEIFDNVSDRRTHEFDLSQAIARELAGRGVRVRSTGAEHTLRGRIFEIRNPSVVEGKTDVVLVGSLQFHVEATLVGPDGKPVWSEERTETVSFAGARGETLESARREMFDRLARWLASRLEKGW